jgi:CBS domain-containing protein
MDTPLIDAMKIFLQKRVSALPLLDGEGRVVDIYAKFDAINLAADKTYNNLDQTVLEALKQRSDWFEGVKTCSDKDSLMTVIETIVKVEVHRLIVIDDQKKAVGIISLSDILKHLVLDPPAPELIEDGTATAPALPLVIAAPRPEIPPVEGLSGNTNNSTLHENNINDNIGVCDSISSSPLASAKKLNQRMEEDEIPMDLS